MACGKKVRESGMAGGKGMKNEEESDYTGKDAQSHTYANTWVSVYLVFCSFFMFVFLMFLCKCLCVFLCSLDGKGN